MHTNNIPDKTFRNDYKLRASLRAWSEKNTFVRTHIKPRLRGVYRALNSILPYPRDFILKQIPKGARCCEIGVWRGDFSKRINEKVMPRELYLIDPWFFFDDVPYAKEKLNKYSQDAQDARYASVIKMFHTEISDGKVKVLRMTSEQALPQFPDGYFDLVYIDGNHDYKFVKYDIESYYPKTKPGGILSGDDYRLPDVARAVNEFVTKHNLQKYFVIKNDQFVITKP